MSVTAILSLWVVFFNINLVQSRNVCAIDDKIDDIILNKPEGFKVYSEITNDERKA